MQDCYIIFAKPETVAATDGTTISLPTWKEVLAHVEEWTPVKVLKISGDGHWTDKTEDAIDGFSKLLSERFSRDLTAQDFANFIYPAFPAHQKAVLRRDMQTWG